MSSITSNVNPSLAELKNVDPGVVQEAETRKVLNRNKADIKKSTLLIWVSICVASLGLILIVVVWILLGM